MRSVVMSTWVVRRTTSAHLGAGGAARWWAAGCGVTERTHRTARHWHHCGGRAPAGGGVLPVPAPRGHHFWVRASKAPPGMQRYICTGIVHVHRVL